jgi:hypothetical protein
VVTMSRERFCTFSPFLWTRVEPRAGPDLSIRWRGDWP